MTNRYMLLNEIGEAWNRWQNKWVSREASEATVYSAKSHIGNDLFVAQTKAVRVICGKSITTNALGRNSHIAMHVRESERRKTSLPPAPKERQG